MSDLTDPVLPVDSDARKEIPLFSGVLNYFPLALAAVARHSKFGNDKHNPGQPLHWSRGKSMDHADCIARHLLDHLTVHAESGEYEEARALAWRSLALLQELEEKRLGKPASRGSSTAITKDDTIHVVVGVLVDQRGRVLLQRRSLKDENFPGAWECPGGGVEPGESDGVTLVRELDEELDINTIHRGVQPIWRGQIAGYKGGKHDFRFYLVTGWDGEPSPIDGQTDIGWFSLHKPPAGLTPANMLAWPSIVDHVQALGAVRKGKRR